MFAIKILYLPSNPLRELCVLTGSTKASIFVAIVPSLHYRRSNPLPATSRARWGGSEPLYVEKGASELIVTYAVRSLVTRDPIVTEGAPFRGSSFRSRGKEVDSKRNTPHREQKIFALKDIDSRGFLFEYLDDDQVGVALLQTRLEVHLSGHCLNGCESTLAHVSV